MTDVHDFRMPDVGEGLTEADIVAWHVAEGDSVAINDIVVEIETAKSIVELPSPFAGTVASIHYREGHTVAVGDVIVSITTDVGAAEPLDPTAQPVPPVPPVPPVRPVPPVPPALPVPPIPPDSQENSERQEVLVGYGPTRTAVARRPRRKTAERPIDAAAYNNPNERPYATPPVRKMARLLGIDLQHAPATGSRGQITRADLDNLAAPTADTAPVNDHPAEVRIPIVGVRKHTARAMVASAFTAPHVTEWVTVDVTRSLRLLDRMREDRDFAGVRLSPLVLVIRAAVLALTRHPEANAKWDADADEIVRLRDVNVGVAVATPRGLLVPNIRGAQTHSTLELATALHSLISEARAGKTPPDRMRAGTFTVTNIGVFGVDGGTPILNPGEAAILCVGQICRRPWEHKGRVALRSTTTLSLSFDHRLVDGELGSRLLADIARVLEHPATSLAW